MSLRPVFRQLLSIEKYKVSYKPAEKSIRVNMRTIRTCYKDCFVYIHTPSFHLCSLSSIEFIVRFPHMLGNKFFYNEKRKVPWIIQDYLVCWWLEIN